MNDVYGVKLTYLDYKTKSYHLIHFKREECGIGHFYYPVTAMTQDNEVIAYGEFTNH